MPNDDTSRPVTRARRAFGPDQLRNLPREDLRKLCHGLLLVDGAGIEDYRSTVDMDEFAVAVAGLWHTHRVLVRIYHRPITASDTDDARTFATATDALECLVLPAHGSGDSELNMMSRQEKIASGVSEGWYDIAVYNGTDGVCPSPRPVGPDGELLQCDEYPYFTSSEGGPTSSGGILPDQLRLIDADQNKLEGQLLNGFYTDCGIRATPLGSPGRQYLVIPLPQQSLVPTVAYCRPQAVL